MGIFQVRKQYLEHIMKLLAINYENNQSVTQRYTRLSSAIWRCANIIEINAARSSMLVDLYRRNILLMVDIYYFYCNVYVCAIMDLP